MTNIKQWRSLTLQVRKVFGDLPTSTERDEMVRSLRELIAVLEELGKALGRLPTAEEAAKAKEALAKLETTVDSNPLLRGRSVRGNVKPRVRNRPRATPSELGYSKEIVDQGIARLSRMPGESLRDELENSKSYPNSLLRAILIQMDVRVPSKGVRREMMEQLVVTITNRRTYQGLRGEQERG